MLLSCYFNVRIVRGVVNTSSEDSACTGGMTGYQSSIFFSVSLSFSRSLSTTFFGLYRIGPVSLNTERMVEDFNAFYQIDPSASRNSTLLKSMHPVPLIRF